MSQNNKDNYTLLQTKISPQQAELLDAICNVLGVNTYQIFQMFFYTLCKASAPIHELSPIIRKIMTMLETDAAWSEAFNMANPNDLDVAQVVLILQQKDKKGFGAVMIDRPFVSDARMTECVDDILERVAEVSMVGLYKELRQIGLLYQSESLRETLTKMCDAELIEQLNQLDAQEMPQMGDFHDFGKVIEWGNKAKRKPHRTPDSVANQQLRLFDPDKPYGEQADAYMRDLERRAKEEELGFRPFDQEY